MSKAKIAIIGGGASGLFAAGMLSNCDIDVTIYEKNNKLGKKILASGNGKCNFTNIDSIEGKYNNDFANKVISKFDVEETLKIFSDMGLIYKSDSQGRCYPISESANSVLDCLKSKLNKVKILLESAVDSLETLEDKVAIISNGNKLFYDYVICSTGSSASNLGNEKAYSYLEKYGVEFSAIRSSLVPIIVKENVKELTGVRVKCTVKLMDENDNLIYEENGEVLFKDNGLSGIAIFNVSSYINRFKDRKYKIVLDISGDLKEEDLKKYFINKHSKELLFKGFLNDKIGDYIYKKCELNKCFKIDDIILNRIIGCIKKFEFNVDGLYPIKDAQVCNGGVSLLEIDDNLCFKKNNRVYFAGELLDIDGVCGGYNLQFAWSSAGVVVSDIKKRLGL